MRDPIHDDLPNTLSRDLFDMLCGDLIGTGAGRRVYRCDYDPKLVVKIEMESGSFQNVVEWEMWSDVQHHRPTARWLAPCKAISACGLILLQARTVPAYKYPERLPGFLTDLKKQNYGMLDGKFVCHDYGIAKMVDPQPLKLRKVEWWDPTEDT